MTDITTTQRPPSAPRASAAWPVVSIFLTLILVVGLPVAYLVIHAATAPGRFLSTLSQAAADALRPKLTINEIVLNSISDVRKEDKLVVMSAGISTDVMREEGSSSWGIYWGTNVARVAVKDARVQYVIDCGQLETSDYVYNEPARVLSVTFPRPHVDTSMVDIDPGRVETLDLRGGWARFDKEDTKDHALAELRPKIVSQAQVPYIRELAEARGIESAGKLLQPLASALSRDGVSVHVAYRD
jgi:hypothetical protein